MMIVPEYENYFIDEKSGLRVKKIYSEGPGWIPNESFGYFYDSSKDLMPAYCPAYRSTNSISISIAPDTLAPDTLAPDTLAPEEN